MWKIWRGEVELRYDEACSCLRSKHVQGKTG